MLVSTSAQAIPAYARQTGSACADCHAGSYGPALTPYGMRFKLNGYTDTDGNGVKIPVAGQVTESHNVPARGESSSALTEADLYVAGRVSDQFGGYAKIEADNIGHDKYNTRLSNLDLRFVAKDQKLAGKDLTIGVSVNNSPGFEDPIAALPSASLLGPPGVTGTLLNPSSPNAPANRVIGATVYGLLDSSWYGEIGTYNALPTSVQDRLGYAQSGDPGRLSDTGYFRFAYMKDLKRQFFSAGVVALTTKRQLPRTASKDDLTDLGYDLSYQFLGNRQHIVQVSYVNILEQRRYGNELVIPNTPDLVASDRANVRDQTLSVTYTFMQSYGVTVSHLVNTGSHDPVRYPPYGDPDTTSNLMSLYWTPFGRDDSWTSRANLKLAATWFRFTKFNGRANNIFGAPPGTLVTNAGDLNAFTLSASAAF
ncbi:cytochrome C [Dyella sp. Tek66A03]|uniref:cytochrome C n=1 Tax=Dyella sp. Tek66A03 TaxID=3458298 RepID=UPI00403EB1CA